MANKTYVSRTIDVLNGSDVALASSACFSGSRVCVGFSKLVGGIRSNASTLAAASGVRVYQSVDFGSNWDILSASDALTADTALTHDIDIVGNAIQVVWRNGATAASGRAHFYLRP